MPADATSTSLPTSSAPAPPQTKRPREIRLDFFRGACLFIIFIAHIFDNAWAQVIPARFGFSDATEIFVFCSGMASAIAFGNVFERRGFALGTARVVFRMWQVYWAHIAVLIATFVLLLYLEQTMMTVGPLKNSVMLQNMTNEHAAAALIGIMILTWVPPFFDILPMYLVILAMIPVVVALYWQGPWYAAAFCLGLWFISGLHLLELSREPWGNAPWFFNPFSWQLIFFIGFALMRGWLPSPPENRMLIRAAIAVLVVAMPFSWLPLVDSVPGLASARSAIWPLIDKTHLGLFRIVHFLALAYLACIVAGEGGRRIQGAIATVVCKVGQQSLAVFVSGLMLSFLATSLLDTAGRNAFTVSLANIAGIALLIAIAYTTAWFKSQPWSRPAPATPTAAAPTSASSDPDGERQRRPGIAERSPE